jgi:hypothetical protein
MSGASSRKAFCVTAILCVAVSVRLSADTTSAQSRPPRGDGIFTPIIAPAATIDKTGRPTTVEVTQPEPSFSASMVPGNPTGDVYVISFPTGSVGGPCTYTGTGRYLIESTGNLTFQILAECEKLRRSYSYMICMLDENLRCSEAPWWYFKDRAYAVTNKGVVINDSTVVPWKDSAEAPEELQAAATRIKALRNRFRNDPHVVHSRVISCRNFHPAAGSYEIHELSTTCLIKSLCDGIPSADSLRDGDPIDWNSPVGSYIKQQNKISDISTWSCWIRTQ